MSILISDNPPHPIDSNFFECSKRIRLLKTLNCQIQCKIVHNYILDNVINPFKTLQMKLKYIYFNVLLI